MASSPASHWHTDHGHGYASLGSPVATGIETARGSAGASTGSQRRSFSAGRVSDGRSGRRATRSSPSR